MQFNATQLIDHLDDSLQDKGSPEMDKQIREDQETAQEWQHLRSAVEAVREAGLYEQIDAVRTAWKAKQISAVEEDIVPAQKQSSKTTVRNISRNVMRVAACLLLLSGAAAILKYATTSSSGLYGKYYTSYTLNANRAAGRQDAIGQAYDQQHWSEVLSLFNAADEKNNKSWFLAGMADLELKKYDEAVGKFEAVLAANLQTGTDYFQDEAEFYLAMSCLARNDVNEAIPLLEKIKANRNHLFHDRVSRISSLDLRIAQYKNAR